MLIIRYHKIAHQARDSIRKLESKGHMPYIRYLLLKRTPMHTINMELTRMGLSVGTEQQYEFYFDEVLFPLIKKYKLTIHYKAYKTHKKDKELNFSKTFGKNDIERVFFCQVVKETDTQQFFTSDIRKYYGVNIPLDINGDPVFTYESNRDLTVVLMHEKRHIIDGMLADGFSPSRVSTALDEKYDIEVKPELIADYGKSFMNFKRKEVETLIIELQEDRDALQQQLDYVRETDDEFSMGERVVVISSLRNNIAEMDQKIRGLQSAHATSSFGQGVMEYGHIREMFTDIMQRSYKRYKSIDRRTEDAVVDPLAKIVTVMAKATEKILSIDTAMSQTTKKTITEEMLEVISPTLARVEEEERLARAEYMSLYAPVDGEEIEIIGDDE